MVNNEKIDAELYSNLCSAEKQYTDEIAELQKVLIPIQTLLKQLHSRLGEKVVIKPSLQLPLIHNHTTTVSKPYKANVWPIEYKAGFTQEELAYYVVNLIPNSSAEALLEKVFELEPNRYEDKIKGLKRLKSILTVLLNNYKVINAKQDPTTSKRRFVYST